MIPLGGCSVEECPCGSQKFTIKITNEHFKVRLPRPRGDCGEGEDVGRGGGGSAFTSFFLTGGGLGGCRDSRRLYSMGEGTPGRRKSVRE